MDVVDLKVNEHAEEIGGTRVDLQVGDVGVLIADCGGDFAEGAGLVDDVNSNAPDVVFRRGAIGRP